MERASAASVPVRRTRRRPEDISADLLAAAAVEFASHGFDGASTRRIAARAGAHQPQINYHFTSKEHLWRATVTRLFGLMAVDGLPDADGPGIVPVFAGSIRRFLAFSAEYPELNRIINLEATAPSPRLEWLVETHLAPLYDGVLAIWAAIRESGCGGDLTGPQAWEVITSYGALHFANAPMLSMLEGTGGATPADPGAHADAVLSILFPGGTGPGGDR